jgi:antirestriction protein
MEDQQPQQPSDKHREGDQTSGEQLQEDEQRQNEHNERDRREAPRIYVASLADYNAGHLHGEWIDADAEAEQIHAAIHVMLQRSPTEDAEEFAIFDFDGFHPWKPDEYESIETVATVAQGIAEHGQAFAHWVGVIGTTESTLLDGFEDAYLGHWESTVSYGEDLVESIGLWTDQVVPDSLSAYVQFDYEAFADDLTGSGDIVASEGDGGVYLFEGNR